MADLRSLPKVDKLAASPLLARFSPALRTKAARLVVEELREEAKNGGFDPTQAEKRALTIAEALASPGMRRVINASGVILHTGLGRARLAEPAVRLLAEVASGHSSTEIDLATGGRGDRQSHVRGLLCELTGAEDAFVVNNGAAAIFLALRALGEGGEVLLSRGEMVEIGGQFRMPEIVAESGAKLVEVGCTNKTRLADYADAIGERTVAILRCHPSNYRVVGFTAAPSDRQLAKLAQDSGIPFLHDLGNGCLWDTAPFGLAKELTVQMALAHGADIVTVSGDKMLGGPQSGMILGNAQALAEIARHPLARVLRVDKLTLSALEATLRLHAERRQDEIPVYRYMASGLDVLKSRAEILAKAFPGSSTVELGETEVGGGSVPGQGIPTWRIGLETADPDELSRRLRQSSPPILSRIEHGRVWLDPRTMEPEEVDEAARILEEMH